jgi:hypothetical protein
MMIRYLLNYRRRKRINFDLLRDALKFVAEHPEQHKQGVWRCRSGMCVAGITAELAGGRWLSPVPSGFNRDRDAALIAEDDDDPADVVYYGLTPYIHVQDRAQRLLGLTVSEVDDLFDAKNTYGDLVHLMRRWWG